MFLCSIGHVATRRDLELAGLSRSQIAALAQSPLACRLRRGLYGCAHLTEAERIAADVGARLDCVTVLARHKVWVGHSRGVHLRMPHNAGELARHRLERHVNRLARAGYLLLRSRKIAVHWSACDAARFGHRLEVPILDALRQAFDCLPPDDLVASLESALHLRLISPTELEGLLAAAPARFQRALAQVTPGAQSGYETKARLKLQRLGHTVEIQVPVPGVGHEDLVIDGVVSLEIDGRETHADTFERDRERDLGTEGYGLRSLRIPAVWVDTRWDEVVIVVERMVADAKASRWAAEQESARTVRLAARRAARRARTEAEILPPSPGLVDQTDV